MKKYTAFKKRPSGVTLNTTSRVKPDQSFTIQQILTRQKAGLPYPENKNPIYTGKNVVKQDLDLVEVKDLRDKIKALEKEQKQLQSKKHIDSLKDQWKKEFEDEIKQKAQQEGGGTTTPQQADNQQIKS